MKKILIGIIIIAGIKVDAQTYNPEKAAEYASFWCNKRNVKNSPYFDSIKWGGPYIDYERPENGGKDCAAFVSQCLKCGGLNLRAGTDGKGANVKKHDSVIAVVDHLITHLKSHQQVDVGEEKYYGVVYNHEVGDPAFMGDNASSKMHSTICSDNSGSTKQYSAHTSDKCGKDLPNCGNSGWHYITSFHIKSSIPDHCTNCVLDGDETDVDCGGSCPPCAHAKSMVKYNYNTSHLPRETRAFDEITAGNATVEVLPGQDVRFITAGAITLQPGFKVHKGGSFQANAKRLRKDIGSDCNLCIPDPRPYEFCRNGNLPYFGWDITGVTSVTVEICQYDDRGYMYTIYVDIVDISTDGFVAFWDLKTGVKTGGNWDQYKLQFRYLLIMTTCSGETRNYSGFILVWDNPDKCRKSLSPHSVPIDSTDMGENNAPNYCFIHPNPNNGTFTVNINFDPQEVISVQVLSIVGQSIYKQEGLPNKTIQLPQPTSGVYYVEVVTATQKFIRKMVVM